MLLITFSSTFSSWHNMTDLKFWFTMSKIRILTISYWISYWIRRDTTTARHLQYDVAVTFPDRNDMLVTTERLTTVCHACHMSYEDNILCILKYPRSNKLLTRWQLYLRIIDASIARCFIERSYPILSGKWLAFCDTFACANNSCADLECRASQISFEPHSEGETWRLSHKCPTSMLVTLVKGPRKSLSADVRIRNQCLSLFFPIVGQYGGKYWQELSWGLQFDNGLDAVKVPLLRRLCFESYSATTVDMKQRGSGPTEATTRRPTQATCPRSLRILRSFGTSLWKRRPERNSPNLTSSKTAPTSRRYQLQRPWRRTRRQTCGSSWPAELALAADMGGVLSLSKHEDLRVALQSAKLEVPPSEHGRVWTQQSGNAHEEFWNQLSLRAEGKVAVGLASRQISRVPHAGIARQGSRFFSIQRTVAAVCGRLRNTNTQPVMFTKGGAQQETASTNDRGRRADERGQWQGKWCVTLRVQDEVVRRSQGYNWKWWPRHKDRAGDSLRRCSHKKWLGPGQFDSGVCFLMVYCVTLAVLATWRCRFGHSDSGSPLLFHGLGRQCRSAQHWPNQVLPACFFLAERVTRIGLITRSLFINKISPIFKRLPSHSNLGSLTL